MPDILKQVGPQQYQFLKQQIGAGVDGKAAADDDDDDDVPELVGTFEDANKWTSCVWEDLGRVSIRTWNVDTPFRSPDKKLELEMMSLNIWDNLGVACVKMQQALAATSINQYLSILLMLLMSYMFVRPIFGSRKKTKEPTCLY